MEKMKERIVTFGDAIIAIIITIMVLELPIKLSGSGELDFYLLFRSIGIYFISFCFVGDLWYQGAQIFSRTKKMKNKDFVLYMFFLFALSLVPTFTRLLIEDTNRQVVLLYGLLSFIVSFLWVIFQRSLEVQLAGEKQQNEFFKDREIKRQQLMLVFRITVLVFAYFFPKVGLFIYLALPIIGFLQNVVDKEENNYLAEMDEEQKQYYIEDMRRERGRNVSQYLTLLRSSLGDSDNKERHEWWLKFNQQWQQELQKQKSSVIERLKSAETEQERRALEREQSRLNVEEQKIQQLMARAEKRESFKSRKNENRGSR